MNSQLKCPWKSRPLRFSKSKDTGDVRLDLAVERALLILHGNESQSSGSLLTAFISTDVLQEGIDTENISATLKFKFVLHHHLGRQAKCKVWEVVIQKWEFFCPAGLSKGKHQFPISTLVPGNIPSTIDAPSFSVQFELTADFSHRSHMKHVCRAVSVRRVLSKVDSLRLFPATFEPLDLQLQVQYQKLIFPDEKNSVSLRLDNVLSHDKNEKRFEFWRLKRVTWRLEENIKIQSFCQEPHLPQMDGIHEDVSNCRCIETGSIWKNWQTSDWPKGEFTTLDFTYTLSSHTRFTRGQNYAAATQSPYGIDVSHTLIVDMILCKEIIPEERPKMAMQSIIGRTLRVERDLIVSEKLGSNLDWEEEVPPVYEDVPQQPPSYD